MGVKQNKKRKLPVQVEEPGIPPKVKKPDKKKNNKKNKVTEAVSCPTEIEENPVVNGNGNDSTISDNEEETVSENNIENGTVSDNDEENESISASNEERAMSDNNDEDGESSDDNEEGGTMSDNDEDGEDNSEGDEEMTDDKEDETEEKTSSEPEFCVKTFREALKKPSAFTALIKFIKAPVSKIHEYLDSGGNSLEILRAMQQSEKKNMRNSTIVLEALQIVLFEIIARSNQHIPNAVETCRYLMNTHITTIHMMLSTNSQAKQRKVALKLLTTMVSLNSMLGRDILSHFSLHSEMVDMLSAQKNPNDVGSVRTCFIHFLMSFLVEGDVPLIRQLLSRKGILTSVIPGLIYDLPSTINLFLTAIKNHVLENINISKTIKMQTFNTFAVQHLVKLYDWLGPSNFTNTKMPKRFQQKHKRTQEANPQDMEIVQKSVHDLMLVLCTSHRYGIVFQDKTLGTSNKCYNQLLSVVIKSIEKPWENEKQADLVIATLKTSPDLFKNCIAQVAPYLAPRNSKLWLKALLFVKKLISEISPDKITKIAEHSSAKLLSTVISILYMPKSILKYFDNAFFQSTDLAIHQEVFSLLHIMLQQVNNSIKSISSLQVLRNCDVSQCKNLIVQQIKQYFPSVDNLLACLQISFKLKKEMSSDDSKELKIPPVIDYVEGILNVLLSYYSCNSAAFDNIHVDLDPTLLLQKINELDEKNDESGNLGSMCLKTFELLLHVNMKVFLPDKPLFKSTFPTLMKKFAGDKWDISEQVKNILVNLIHSTGLYDANKNEIEIWLFAYKHLDQVSQEIVADYLCDVMIQSYKDSGKYFNKMAKLHKQSLEEDNEIINTGYDDIFENMECDTHETLQNDLEINNLGPILICALKIFQEPEYVENSAVQTYLSLVSLYLFHNQHSFRIVANIVQNSNLPILEQYIQHWLSNDQKVPIKKIFKVKPLITRLSKALFCEEPIDIYDLLKLEIKEEQTDTFVVLGKHVTTSERIQSVEMYCLLNMCLFYLSRLAQTNNLKEEVVENIGKACTGLYDVLCGSGSLENKIDLITMQCMKTILTNPIILLYFTPIPKKKRATEILITKFVSKFIEHIKCKDTSLMNTYQKYLVPYKSKIIRTIKTAISKQTVLKNEEIISLMELLDMNFDDSLDLLNSIVDLEYTNFVSIENHISSWCKVLIFILTKLCNASDPKNSNDISGVISSKLAKLYLDLISKLEVEINFDLLEDSLYKLVMTFPYTIPSFSCEFEHMINSRHISKTGAKLMSLCLERDWKQQPHFIKFASDSENISKKEIIFPLLLASLKHGFDDVSIFQRVYDEHKTSILKVIEKPHKAGQVYKENYRLLCLLIHKCMEISSCTPITNKVLKFEVSELFHMEMLDQIYTKVLLSNPKDTKYVANYYILLVTFLNIIVRKEVIEHEKIHCVLNLLIKWSKRTTDVSFNRTNILKHASWEIFCKLALKNGLKITGTKDNYDYSNGILLKVLSKLCKLLYENDAEEAGTLFQMSVSHSEFLNVMLNPEENDTKTNLLQLLFCLAQKNPSVMRSAHVPVLLSAYHASLALSDRLILAMLQLYEKSGVSLYEYRPFLWGESAVNHYSVKGSVGNNLWRQPSMSEVLDLLEPGMVNTTIKKFPLWRCLDATKQIYDNNDEDLLISSHNDQHILETCIDRSVLNFDDENNIVLRDLLQDENNVTSCLETSKGRDLYDPAFFLPLFSLLFAPESAPATSKAAVSGATALIWRAMGSLKEDTRGAACLAMTRLRGHIDSQRNAKDKDLWLQLIDSVRKGMSQEQEESSESVSVVTPSLSSVASLFLSRTSSVLTRPLHELYKFLANYLLVKETMEFKTVPEMLLLLHSPNPEYKIHRIWMLELLRDGLKSMSDFEILLNSFAYKFVMDFYSCSLCDKDCKILILNIINNTIKIPRAADFLVRGHGLLPWLQGVIINLKPNENDLVMASIITINNLRCSLISNQISQSLAVREDKKILKSDFDLSLEITNSISHLLVLLSSKLSPRTNAKTMIKYLKTIYHIMNDVKLFTMSDVLYLTDLCDKIICKDSECAMLLKYGCDHAEPLQMLIESIAHTDLDNYVELTNKYLTLFVRKWMNQQNDVD